MEQMSLQDLVECCRLAGVEPEILLSTESRHDPLTAVLNQIIALRQANLPSLSLELVDRAEDCGFRSVWLTDNRARALVELNRCSEAFQLWEELRDQREDNVAQDFASRALDQFCWPSDLLKALDAGDLNAAETALDQWLDRVDREASWRIRDLLQVEDAQQVLLRAVPLLEQRLSRQPTNKGHELLVALHQICVPASIDALFRLSATTFFVVGCRAAAGAIDLIARTRAGVWTVSAVEELGFQRAAGDINTSWFVLMRLPAGDDLDQLWVNGAQVTWAIQELRGWPYLDSVQRLLSLARRSQVPLRSVPQLMDAALGSALLELSLPLKDQACWPSFVQRTQRFGRTAQEAEITIVIPLYGRWDFVRGHVAGFAVDPWFQQGRVRLLYVCDDPSLSTLHRWSAMHLSDEELDISLIGLSRNMGFGMACNIGVQVAQTPLVCLMNSDVMPMTSGWLGPLHHHIREHPDHLLGPMLVYENGLIQHVGMTTEVQDNGRRGFPANIHPYKGLSVPELQQGNPNLSPFVVESLSAAMLMFERDRFLEIGGFHPAFGRGDFEDLELSQRWRQQQGELWMVPQSCLCHLERQSMGSGADELAEWSLQANAWLAMELCPDLAR